MKPSFFATALLIALAACNHTGSESATTDTVQHSGPHASTVLPPVSHPVDTSQAGGKNMATLMHENMAAMAALPPAGHPDKDFAALMKIHHQGALDMVRLQIARGSDPALKMMAQAMMDAQQKEIAVLDSLLPSLPSGSNAAYHKEVTTQMHGMHLSADSSGSVDRQFVVFMIPHHQGAIHMAEAYRKSGAQNPRLKAMAGTIIADQQKEIRELQAWLKKNKS